MNLEHVLAVVSVSDIESARDWYQRLFDRVPDNNPMETLIEWQVTASGWLQVTADPKRAGTSRINFAVSHLANQVNEIACRGIVPGKTQEVSKGVELFPITIPDGNVVTLIGNFRVKYQ